MKRIFAGMAAALLAAVLLFPCRVNAVSAQSAIMIDGDSGRVLFEKNPDKQSLIASTTKIMTGLVICEQCNVLDRMRIPKEAVGIEGSSMYLKEGEILTIQELLYGLMLQSGNDAAVALAIYCGGTVEGFVELMNDKAKLLGLENTHFANPNGLDNPDHYSTARDLATLSAYAMNNPIFAKTVSTKQIKIGERYLTNHNKLLWQVDGSEGIKTGYTKAAGRILASSTRRDDRSVIVITINAPSDWQDHKTLIEIGFRDYTVQQLVCAGQSMGKVEILSGTVKEVELIAACDFSYPMAENERFEIIIQGPGFAYAPIACDQEAGFAYVCIGDKTVGKIPLIYGSSVAEQKVNFWKKLWKGAA